MSKFVSLLAVTFAFLTNCLGQLYLVAGSPTPKYDIGYSTELIVVGTDGTVKIDQALVPSKLGIEWMALSNDNRKVLILPKYPDDHIIVFDLDTISVVKSCEQPKTSDVLLIGQWLINSPSRGLVFVQYLGPVNRIAGKDQFLAMIMDPSVACQDSFLNLDASELKHLAAEGLAGVAGLGAHDAFGTSIGSDGSLQTKWLSGAQTAFDYKVPTTLFADMKHPAATIVYDTKQILGLELVDSPRRSLLLFRKSDSTWHKSPESSPGRAFGSIIAAAEGKIRVQGSGMQSAGKSEWRQASGSSGPSIMTRLKEFPLVYPGVLHLYDVGTEKSYEIVTNQGDSEVLLVESGIVYYRVSNKLYSVQIGETTIGSTTLLATDELIRDVHWAFIKH